MYYVVNPCHSLLAHLSQRLIGELIVYPCTGVRHRHPSFTMLIHLINCLANQSQIFCGASLGRGNESLFATSGSHRGLLPIIVCSNDDPRVTLTYFRTRSNFITWAFLYEKVKKMDISETIGASGQKIGRCRQLIQ